VSVDVRWVSCFADVPAVRFEDGLRFWQAATGAAAGEPAGERGEYVPLEPSTGDRFFWLQRVDRDEAGWHLDLHVDDPRPAAESAVELGAWVVLDAGSLLVLETPAGQPFCLVEETRSGRQRPVPTSWPGGGRSLADQICLDLPAPVHDAECDFWAALTGWSLVPSGAPEFSRINPPPTLPIQLLLQRLGADDTGGARAHLDMSADDPAAEVARHLALGAEFVRDGRGWTVLHDPVGLTYCVTHRRPWQPS
jgi:hypothetical protein